MMAIEKMIYLKVSGEKHIIWVGALKNWRLPTQLIIFSDFWAKILKICPPPVNYSYLPPWAISVMSEYPQDGGSICYCYDYCIDVQLKNCVMHCVLGVIECVMSNTCHTDREYPQSGGSGKNADGLYMYNSNVLKHANTQHSNTEKYHKFELVELSLYLWII